MGYAERSYSYRFGKDGFGGEGGGRESVLGGMTPWVKRLLVANVAVYLLNVVGLMPHRWTVEVFGFVPDPLWLLTHPWAPVSYMFVHGGFVHLLFNMVILFFFGPPLERVWGGGKFLRYYAAAGLGGALLHLALAPMVGYAPMVGASGALYGLLLAFAFRWPEAPIYIWGILPIRAKWFVGILAAMALVGTFSGTDSGVASWAHLGGLVTGFAYLKAGDRLERWIQRRGRGGSRQRSAMSRGRDRGLGVVDEGGDGGAGSGRDRPRTGGGDDLDRVNEILDKIRDRGMDSLTAEEREFLTRMSRKYRETED